jgi:Fe-S cluster assembly protein SufB
MATTADREQLTGVKDEYQYGFHDVETPVFKSERGLNHAVIDEISDQKNEPQWMRDFRHQALDIFLSKPLPTWGADLSGIDFEEIFYYLRPSGGAEKDWDDVPENIKNTFERLGIPEAERKFLAGVGAQYDSEVVYHSLKQEWEKLGVIFLDEASVSKIGEEQLFYLMSRGIGADEASAMIVGGFIEPLVKELPMEYAVEMNRLIQLQMEGSIG